MSNENIKTRGKKGKRSKAPKPQVETPQERSSPPDTDEIDDTLDKLIGRLREVALPELEPEAPGSEAPRPNGADQAEGEDGDGKAADVNADAELMRLAKLPAIDYERERRKAAKRLGFRRLKTLDSVVAAKRRELKPPSRRDVPGGPNGPDAETAARPPILVKIGETTRAVNELEARLIAASRDLYQRGGIVSTGFAKMKTWDRKTIITQVIEERSMPALGEDAEAVAKFVKYDKKGDLIPCPPPKALLTTLMARRHRLRLPILTAIANCPSIACDTGELLDKPGYDPSTGILFDPLGVSFPRVSSLPTKQEAEAALRRLGVLLETFKFVSDDDRAVALSALLTAMARRGLPFAPLHAFDAPVAGSGKSLIVDLASILATGHEAGVTAQGNDEETEKRLATLLMRGDIIIALDNCDFPLGHPLINQMMTQASVEVRVLGQSLMISVQPKALVTATGNNLVIKGDLTRRCVIARLDPGTERPELSRFNYDPIIDAKESRGELVACALTVLKAYHNAGRPKPEEEPAPLQSFTHWSDLVRGALIWLGAGDPVATMERLRSNDPVLDAMRTVMSAWLDEFGEDPMSASEAVRKANETQLTGGDMFGRERERELVRPELQDAFLTIAGRSGKIDIRRFGTWLGKRADRIIALDGESDFAAIREGPMLHGNRQWRVRKGNPPPASDKEPASNKE
jgi:putative DNA primase/helicase